MKDKPLGDDALRALDELGAKGPMKVSNLSRYITSHQWNELWFARCDTTFEVRKVENVTTPSTSRKKPFDCPVDLSEIDVWSEDSAVLEERSFHILECDECEGEGKIDCDVCNGSAEITCPDCNGSGKVLKHYKTVAPKQVNCKKCRAKGIVKCPNCKKGLITCLTCDGKKRLDAQLTIKSSLETAKEMFISDSKLEKSFPVLNETSDPHEIATINEFDVPLFKTVEGDEFLDVEDLPEDVAAWTRKTQKRRSDEARTNNWRIKSTLALAGSYSQVWIKYKLKNEETRVAFVPKAKLLYPPKVDLFRKRSAKVNGATGGIAALLGLFWLVYAFRDPIFVNGFSLTMGLLLASIAVMFRQYLKNHTLRDIGDDTRRNHLIYHGYGIVACAILALVLGILNVPTFNKLDLLLSKGKSAEVAEMASYLSKKADTWEEVDRLTGFFLKAASLTPNATDRLPMLQKLSDGTSHQAEKEEAIAKAALELARNAMSAKKYREVRKYIEIVPEGKRQLSEVGALEREMTFEEGMAFYEKRRCDKAAEKLKSAAADERYAVRIRNAIGHCEDIKVLVQVNAAFKERKYLEAINLAKKIGEDSLERPAAENLQTRCRAHIELAQSVPELRFLDH